MSCMRVQYKGPLGHAFHTFPSADRFIVAPSLPHCHVAFPSPTILFIFHVTLFAALVSTMFY